MLNDNLARNIVQDMPDDIEALPGGIQISGLTADSRHVMPGFLFAALAGTQNDGAKFVHDAIERGAAIILAGSNAEVPDDINVPVLRADNPRLRLAELAAQFYQVQPETVVAVTGTNGKTSVASFLRQIWESVGHTAASVGTIGVTLNREIWPLEHTTPDPVELHELLRNLVGKKVTHAVLETSSHGLAQYRVDGIKFAAAGFTNISRDHLDYHSSFEDYFAQKSRLFSEILTDNGIAVVHGTDEAATELIEIAAKRGLKTINVGRGAKDLNMLDIKRDGFGQRLSVEFSGKKQNIHLPLVGEFQAENALVAAGLAIACGMSEVDALAAMKSLQGARGRLEHVGSAECGAPIFVDYAHTPDALETAITALRPYARKRIVVVFGAGGDRDQGKRPEMGSAVARLADIAIVTDDNPRGEDPAGIRAAIMANVPAGIEIGDRRTAIAAGIRLLRDGDILLIAGKGHEAGQAIGTEVVPFSDHEAVAEVLAEVDGRG